MPVILQHLCENASPPLTMSPSVETPLQYAPQPFVEASLWMIIWDSRCWIFLPLQSFKFSSNKGVPPWLNFPVSYDHCSIRFSVELIFASIGDIKTGFELVKWSWQLMTIGQLTLWDLRLKFLVASKSLDIAETHGLIFSLKEQNSCLETPFVSQGAGLILIFWGWSQNPNVATEKPMCLLLWEFLVTSFPLATYRLGK